MEKMTYRRDDLLKVLRENRANHRKEFEGAIKGYEEDAIARLQGLVKQMKAGKRPSLMISMPIPQDHTKDYDRVIRMLEMCVTDIIELDETDFQQYVQDDWAWKGQFSATNAMYMKSQ